MRRQQSSGRQPEKNARSANCPDIVRSRICRGDNQLRQSFFSQIFRRSKAMPTTSVPHGRLTDDALVRLICLPYAGGGSAVFHRWRSALPPRVDLVPLCLPGHDGRLAESPRTDLCGLARELVDDLVSALDRAYVLLGHSLGAWITFELARELRRRNLPQPELLIVAGARPPHFDLPRSPLYQMPDDEFVAAMQHRYDGIPPAILASAELLQLLLPILRADIQMVETYHHDAEPPLDVEFLVLGGTEDPAVSPGQLADWRRHTSRACSVRQFPGGHFFLFRGENQNSQSTAEPPSPALRTIATSLERFIRNR
jgi:surfactin synthase thioesterase subunit